VEYATASDISKEGRYSGIKPIETHVARVNEVFFLSFLLLS
jgi:hypothetical protein